MRPCLALRGRAGGVPLENRGRARPFSPPSNGGAIARGLAAGRARRIVQRTGLGKLRRPAEWRASFIAQSLASLIESAALSGTRHGPQCAQPRTATQRARALRIAAGSDHVGSLKSIQSGTTSSASSTPHAPLEWSAAPALLWHVLCTRGDPVELLYGPCSLNARTQPRGAP